MWTCKACLGFPVAFGGTKSGHLDQRYITSMYLYKDRVERGYPLTLVLTEVLVVLQLRLLPDGRKPIASDPCFVPASQRA